nr:PREDICTED: uncharacterized protein LOC105663360 [Megachile rotundata]
MIRKEGGREVNRWRYETNVGVSRGCVGSVHFTAIGRRTLFSPRRSSFCISKHAPHRGESANSTEPSQRTETTARLSPTSLSFSASVAATVAVRSSLSTSPTVFLEIVPFVVVLLVSSRCPLDPRILVLRLLTITVSLFFSFFFFLLARSHLLFRQSRNLLLSFHTFRRRVRPLYRAWPRTSFLLSYKFHGALLIQHVTKIE